MDEHEAVAPGSHRGNRGLGRGGFALLVLLGAPVLAGAMLIVAGLVTDAVGLLPDGVGFAALGVLPALLVAVCTIFVAVVAGLVLLATLPKDTPRRLRAALVLLGTCAALQLVVTVLLQAWWARVT